MLAWQAQPQASHQQPTLRVPQKTSWRSAGARGCRDNSLLSLHDVKVFSKLACLESSYSKRSSPAASFPATAGMMSLRSSTVLGVCDRPHAKAARRLYNKHHTFALPLRPHAQLGDSERGSAGLRS
jgi:hypothetical protein